MKRIIVPFLACLLTCLLWAQDEKHYVLFDDYANVYGNGGKFYRNPARVFVPNIPGFVTLKADLHMHTYYSDAQVSPQMRVEEAFDEDLDVLAITDHHPGPRAKTETTDLNVAYDKALPYAKQCGIMLVKGFEITGQDPVGHINILFLNNLNDYRMTNMQFKLAEADSLIDKAVAEGAVITTNHPGWPDENSTLSEYIIDHIRKGHIQGIEIFNSREFYPMAIDHANQYGLAMIGASDSHYPMASCFDLSPNGNHRPMTLVFARERTPEAVKEALCAHRTLAWANHTLAGPRNLLAAFIRAAIKVVSVAKEGPMYSMKLWNNSAIPFLFDNGIPGERFRIPAGGYVVMQRRENQLNKLLQVKNALVASDQPLELPLSFLLQDEDKEVFMPFIADTTLPFSEKGLSFKLVTDEGDTFYTTDGTEPTRESTPYQGEILLEHPCCLKAVTYRGDKMSDTFVNNMNFSMASNVKRLKTHGVNFKFYEHPDILSTTDVERIGVLKSTGVKPDLNISEGIGQEHFGYVFTGIMTVPETGLYQFMLQSNDGSDLYIGTALACDNDQHEGYRAAMGSIYLQKGAHPFRLRYFEGYGGESLALFWKKPSDTTFVEFPQDNLYVEQNNKKK